MLCLLGLFSVAMAEHCVQQGCKAAAQILSGALVFVQDLIEVRSDAWVPRLEVEGPNRVEQVHADARWVAANRATAAAGGHIRQHNSDQGLDHDV